ncbi:slit homolog 3 protein-like [Hydractinia symbiolongicarpus]|uniref:slit homolog 3 protein-like n=1 Tax=Hydractinia symbiolongicarpus TaxID=13093 RepID=UPI0025509513|nr:slit homolog 3 protein-like [Hydractinia symbiolongicarpus]XP_057316007.1 slit homolog 3 protein-like [Hydractinia symbiolongicarpus]
MPALTSLSIYESKIEVVTKEDFVGLQKLKRLELRENGLKKIEDMAFSELPNLIYLNLEKNLIQSIPEYTFASNSSLLRLKLRRNKINHLFSNSFDGLRKLTFLELEENKIENLPTGLFSALSSSNLMIQLNNNKIKKIPNGLFSNQASLYSILVNENEVSEIGDKAFVGITFTDGIDLSSNKIISISASVFEKASVPAMLLAKNPLKCDCGFYKMLAVIQESSKKPMLRGTCSLPVMLSGLPISNSSAIRQSQCSACHLNATCMNNGRCVSFSMTNYTCECTDGFKGERCQTKISSTFKGVKELVLPLVGAFLAIIFVILVIAFFHWYIRRSAVGNRSQKNYSAINT